MKFHIGCSGWSYKYWRGAFYPKDIPLAKWFEYYASIFDTVELNTTFYHLPKEQTVKNWKQKAPKNFCFAVKASRLITHYKRLKHVDEVVATFFERMKYFGKKLGPILYQLPEKFALDYELLKSFLKLLSRGYTHIFELRHPSWWINEVFELLDKHKAGFCVYVMEDTKTPIVAPGKSILHALSRPD